MFLQRFVQIRSFCLRVSHAFPFGDQFTTDVIGSISNHPFLWSSPESFTQTMLVSIHFIMGCYHIPEQNAIATGTILDEFFEFLESATGYLWPGLEFVALRQPVINHDSLTVDGDKSKILHRFPIYADCQQSFFRSAVIGHLYLSCLFPVKELDQAASQGDGDLHGYRVPRIVSGIMPF